MQCVAMLVVRLVSEDMPGTDWQKAMKLQLVVW